MTIGRYGITRTLLVAAIAGNKPDNCAGYSAHDEEEQ